MKLDFVALKSINPTGNIKTYCGFLFDCLGRPSKPKQEPEIDFDKVGDTHPSF